MALPPLPEAGYCGAIGGRGGGGEGGGSVRYPFLSNASTGVGGRGSYGGDTGPTLSRIPSSLSIIDTSEDEADALAVRNRGDNKLGGVAAGEHGAAPAGGGRGKPGENGDDGVSVSGRSSVGGTGRGGGTVGGGRFGISGEEEGDDIEQGIPPQAPSSGTPSSSLTHDAVRRNGTGTAKPWSYSGRTLRKIKSIDEGSDDQECFGSSGSGLLFPLSSSISNTARFFRSNGGGGGASSVGGGSGVSGVFGSCVGLTPPATPDAAAAAAAAAAAREGAGGAPKALQPTPSSFDTGRLTDTVGWHGGGGGGGGGGDGGGADKVGGDKPGDTDFNTGPFFLCGGDANGASQVAAAAAPAAPREVGVAQSVAAAGGGAGKVGGGDGGGDSASTGLFDSTKRWFDSVSTVIAGVGIGGGGGGGELNGQSAGQNNIVAEPLSLNNTE